MNRTKLLTKNKTHQSGQIVYWMSRDQRVQDNWALLFAQELALKNNTSVCVVFCLRKKFEYATERLVDFMLKGLEEVEANLRELNIPFYFLLGYPTDQIPLFLKTHKAGTIISDLSPLKYDRAWKEKIAEKIEIPFYEVDTHNIVPVWRASPKQEFGAYTLRPKIHRLLPEFLDNFPQVQKQDQIKNTATDWDAIRKQISVDSSVPAVTWIKPGEKAAHKMLDDFIEHKLSSYATDRNDPNKDAQSNLSPYIHFGHVAAQRIALKIEKLRGDYVHKEAFLEELIIRKELSDNFCFYNPNYDNPKGFPNWAQLTLQIHSEDDKEFLYTREELEKAKTHDDLWNAAQKEMVTRGKMHGYMRMYWAKKIFEWSKTVNDAQATALYLNDKYFLDGRDPNGYTGVAWSMGGVHDRAWFDRPIFGKIRYMNQNGAKSKFDIKKYIQTYL